MFLRYVSIVDVLFLRDVSIGDALFLRDASFGDAQEMCLLRDVSICVFFVLGRCFYCWRFVSERLLNLTEGDAEGPKWAQALPHLLPLGLQVVLNSS